MSGSGTTTTQAPGVLTKVLCAFPTPIKVVVGWGGSLEELRLIVEEALNEQEILKRVGGPQELTDPELEVVFRHGKFFTANTMESSRYLPFLLRDEGHKFWQAAFSNPSFLGRRGGFLVHAYNRIQLIAKYSESGLLERWMHDFEEIVDMPLEGEWGGWDSGSITLLPAMEGTEWIYSVLFRGMCRDLRDEEGTILANFLSWADGDVGVLAEVVSDPRARRRVQEMASGWFIRRWLYWRDQPWATEELVREVWARAMAQERDQDGRSELLALFPRIFGKIKLDVTE